MDRVLGIDEIPPARIQIGLLRLPSGKVTGLVDVVFADFCRVSLATSARFKARTETSSACQLFEISMLDQADVCSDGSVVLADGTRLRAVEVIPTHLNYETSDLERRILRHVIALTNRYDCYRSIREGVPSRARECHGSLHA